MEPSAQPAGAGAAPGAASALPGARITLGVLLGINLLNYADRYILAAVEPKVRAEFFPPGAPGSEHANFYMGWLTTAFLVAYMLTSPLFGWMADRARRLAIVSLGVALFSLASGLSGLATVFGVLMLSRILVGVGEAAYGPTAPTLIADMFPVRRRGAVLAWFYMAIPVGTALGYMFGGQIGAHYGWRTPFFLVVIPGLILAAWCLLLHEPQRGGADNVTTRRRLRPADYLSLVRTPSYVLGTLGMTAMTFAVGGVSFWMPTYIHEYRLGRAHDDPSLGDTTLLFGAITVVAGIAGTLSGGLLADRLQRRWSGAYFIVSGVGMILGFPLFLGVLHAAFPWVWVFMFGSIFCFMLGTGPINAVLANVTHPSVRASGFAINILVIHALGDAISPPLMGRLMDMTRTPTNQLGDMNAAFLMVGLAGLLSGVLWLAGARFLRRDTLLAPSRLPD
ncbi:MAG: MFS transporter [Phycisphaeraceae bacterium]|nr:MFS transporter [Phycisphaeraceae bacterium]